MEPTLWSGASLSRTPVPLTAQEAFSGILGSISISCWIFLLVPQLLENYNNHSASAISIPFILLWFIGDVCNLVGAAWAGLVPTVVAIAVYFCVADVLLVGQCFYYRCWVDGNKVFAGERRGEGGDGTEVDEEEEPLLARHRSGSLSMPASNQRNTAAVTAPTSTTTTTTTTTTSTTMSTSGTAGPRRGSIQATGVLTQILEDDDGDDAKDRMRPWIKIFISVLGIVVVGTAGWAIAWASGAWTATPTNPTDGSSGDASGGANTDTGPLGAQILGYVSAAAYLGARIPQIFKNARERSCEGLSLLFFILSLMGNLTYGAGILFHSLDRDYLITNTPWLIGSLGTMVEDAIIFIQFHVYAHRRDDDDDDEVVVAAVA